MQALLGRSGARTCLMGFPFAQRKAYAARGPIPRAREAPVCYSSWSMARLRRAKRTMSTSSSL